MSIAASSAINTGSELLNTDELKNAHSEEGTGIFKQTHGGGEKGRKKKISHSCWQTAWSFESRIKEKKKREDEEEKTCK